MSRAQDILLMAVIALYALLTATRLLSMMTGGARVHRVSSKGKVSRLTRAVARGVLHDVR
ncbi:MAG TPA: hypothetical protein VGC87_08000 [Pyrinomonadaceae bacterium]|jgi:hypothetical protein